MADRADHRQKPIVVEGERGGTHTARRKGELTRQLTALEQRDCVART